MKERPILMSTPMVRAILDGRKTQTRRVLKVQNQQLTLVTDGDVLKQVVLGVGEGARELRNPYGWPGDRLWVQESYHIIGHGAVGPSMCVKYLAGGDDWIGQVSSETYVKFRARKTSQPLGGRFMYRDISRIALEITGVRVERLNDISVEDAIAEGISIGPVLPATRAKLAVHAYRSLWEFINGAGSWATNPWVWCLSFKRLTP